MHTTEITAVQAEGAAHAPHIQNLASKETLPKAAASERPMAGDGDLRYIPLTKLLLSPLNVRKTGGGSIDELAMLIDSQGLLQNLIVIPHAGKRGKAGDRFEVVAGGRRLLALRRLAELDKIGKAKPILCKVATRERAVALSMAENSGREAMGVADTVVAYADMVADGASVQEVAIAFGVTPLTVRRRLKLANVSPTLFDLFRKDEVSLDQLMALAISDDHEAQERVWFSLGSYERHASNLRRRLLGREIDAARDPVALFVGVEAYEAAGGVITRDLFEEDAESGYIADGELLHRLAKARLDAEAVTLAKEGWKWIETRTSFDYGERHAFDEAPMSLREATDKERVKLDALATEQEQAEAALEAIYQGDEGDEDSFDEEQADDLEKKAERARRETDKLHSRMRRFSPEVLAVAGAVVSIDHAGKCIVHRGLIKPEDRKEAKKAVAHFKEGAISRRGEGAATDDDTPSLSESLHRKLTAHRTIALQAMLTDNVHVALAAVVHALLQEVVIERAYPTESALEVRAKGCEGALLEFADDMEGSRANAMVQERLDRWRERIPGDAGHLLSWLIEQDDPTLMELLALAAARSLNAVTASPRPHAADAIATALGLDMADWWSASATSYLAQVPKARIVEAVTEAVSADAGTGLVKLKKGEAVANAERLLAGTRWLPAPLRAR